MAGLSASLNASVLILCGAVNALLSKVGELLARTHLQELCPLLLLLLGTSATAADSHTQTTPTEHECRLLTRYILLEILPSAVYQLHGQDCSGNVKAFQKPWLQTALMFVAMAFCLPIGWGIEAWQQRKKRTASSSRDSQRAGGAATRRKVIVIPTAPAEVRTPSTIDAVAAMTSTQLQ
jgi:hypothetical protein